MTHDLAAEQSVAAVAADTCRQLMQLDQSLCVSTEALNYAATLDVDDNQHLLLRSPVTSLALLSPSTSVHSIASKQYVSAIWKQCIVPLSSSAMLGAAGLEPI